MGAQASLVDLECYTVNWLAYSLCFSDTSLLSIPKKQNKSRKFMPFKAIIRGSITCQHSLSGNCFKICTPCLSYLISFKPLGSLLREAVGIPCEWGRTSGYKRWSTYPMSLKAGEWKNKTETRSVTKAPTLLPSNVQTKKPRLKFSSKQHTTFVKKCYHEKENVKLC